MKIRKRQNGGSVLQSRAVESHRDVHTADEVAGP
jgi:hypothetical protein